MLFTGTWLLLLTDLSDVISTQLSRHRMNKAAAAAVEPGKQAAAFQHTYRLHVKFRKKALLNLNSLT